MHTSKLLPNDRFELALSKHAYHSTVVTCMSADK